MGWFGVFVECEVEFWVKESCFLVKEEVVKMFVCVFLFYSKVVFGDVKVKEECGEDEVFEFLVGGLYFVFL